jgi:ribonucleoside-diphosphate reductase alpha chain
VAFVAEELKAVFDPEGGRWMQGRYVPSLLAAIGDVIEQHMLRTGFLTPEGSGQTEGEAEREPVTIAQRAGLGRDDHQVAEATNGEPLLRSTSIAGARICPRCGERALRRVEGCWTCANCTYSRCG